MSSYARALLALLLVGCSNLGWSGCTLGDNGDYQAAVSWLINGTTPNADLCAEQRIARFRFEVRTGSGRVLKTVESDCASTVKLDDGNTYGGFLTTRAFDWGTDYYYSLTPIDTTGNALSDAAESSFTLDFDAADIYDLNYLDYLQPIGTAASLAGEWRVGANSDIAAVAAACASKDIKTVRIMASSALDEKLVDAIQVAEAPCGDGKFVSSTKVLARGSYSFFYEAVSSIGSIVADGDPIELLVDGTKDVVLPREAFLSN
jgi:hypothetical protein